MEENTEYSFSDARSDSATAAFLTGFFSHALANTNFSPELLAIFLSQLCGNILRYSTSNVDISKSSYFFFRNGALILGSMATGLLSSVLQLGFTRETSYLLAGTIFAVAGYAYVDGQEDKELPLQQLQKISSK